MWQFFTALLCIFTFQATAFQLSPVFPTENGPIQGRLEDSDTLVFYGIPYAKPPAGNLRWKDPEQPDPWNDPLQCTERKPQCPQNPCLDGLGCMFNETGSEDCLYLNLFIPPTAANSVLQVLAFIHGGAFELGWGSSEVYDGTRLAKIGNSIVVTMHYRLGVFGTLTYDSDSNEELTGNYGIKDQRLALQWIKNNIAAFGGDPNQVTVFGQSAGAQSIAVHSYTAASAGLFNRAFLMSFPAAMFTRSTSQMNRRGGEIADFVGCTGNVQCLRSKPVQDLLSAANAASTGSNDLVSFFQSNTIHQDGNDVSDNYIDATWREADYMFSFTSGETIREAVLGIPEGLSDFEYRHVLRYWRGCDQCDDIKSLYDLLNNLMEACDISFWETLFPFWFCSEASDIHSWYSSNSDRRFDAADLMSDFIYKCPTNFIARELAENFAEVRKKIWVAKFDQPAPAIADDICTEYACHALDVLYYFGTFEHYPHIFNNVIDADHDLSTAMMCYFTNFARNGNPNTKSGASHICQGLDLTRWRKLSSRRNGFIVYKNSGIEFESNPDDYDKCPLWDDIYSYNPSRY